MPEPLSQKQEPMYERPCSSRETPISVLISPFSMGQEFNTTVSVE